MPEGVIVKGIGGFYYVQTKDALIECKAKGVFRLDKTANTPLPGDKVLIDLLDSETDKGVISKICERTSLLNRPAVANITQLFIVIACTQPEPDLLLADKLIVTALFHNIKPILVFNKIDLRDEGIQSITCQYEKSNFEIILTSTINDFGTDEVLDKMKNQISGFAGQSGVGKSSILNSMLKDLVMLTGTLGEKSFRGKHTTRHAELFALEGNGFVLDTPGFSNYELEDVMYDELWRYYPEMSDASDKCRFNGCIHVSEPDCEVKKLVETKEIDENRYKRYVQLVTVLKEKHKNRWR